MAKRKGRPRKTAEQKHGLGIAEMRQILTAAYRVEE